MTAIKHRINYTWDCWVTDPSDPVAFERDYRVLIDALAEQGFDGLVVWGFLRTSHGGVDVARRVAQHARSRGVRLLPGIGVYSYGGVYLDGDHEFNFETFHAAHPDLRGIAADGSDSPLCPSKPENQEWMRRGIEWLFREIPEIGGVHFETGDQDRWLCACPECKRATAAEPDRGSQSPTRPAIPGGAAGSVVDMLRLIPPLGQVVSEADPSAWNTYSTYSCFWYPAGRVDPRCQDEYIELCIPLPRLQPLVGMPSGYHANWCKGLLDQFELRHEDLPLTPEPNWLNTWFVGSYPGERFGWGWQARWTHRGFFPHVGRVQSTCRQVASAGISGFNLEGGYHPSLLDNQLTLSAFGFFCEHPTASEDAFVEEILVARWGDEGRRLWGWVRPYEDWVWAIHAATYHYYTMIHAQERDSPTVHADGEPRPRPSLDLEGARDANRRALDAATSRAALKGGTLQPLLRSAVSRLWEQSRILDELRSPVGQRLDALLAAGTDRDPDATSQAIADLQQRLDDLPRCWK